MSITLTERAAKAVKDTFSAQKLGEEFRLRVGVTAGGCSGFSYELRPDSEIDAEKDSEYEQHGLKIVVNRKSALFLDGAVLDYYEGIEKQGFRFENPNAVKSCGCGSSFQA